MSTYEWEVGTWKLSTKEFPSLVRDVQRVANAHWHEVFERTQEFWDGLGTKHKRSIQAYLVVVHEHHERQPDDNFIGLVSDVDYLLTYAATREPDPDGKYHTVARARPRRIIQRDLPKRTDMRFECGGGSTLDFARKGRRIDWSVEDNNHAREYGRDHPIAQYFFGRLQRVNWTRGTGGEVWGNDEYNGDSGGVGGGGNYSLGTWGNPAAINNG